MNFEIEIADCQYIIFKINLQISNFWFNFAVSYIVYGEPNRLQPVSGIFIP